MGIVGFGRLPYSGSIPRRGVGRILAVGNVAASCLIRVALTVLPSEQGNSDVIPPHKDAIEGRIKGKHV